MVTDICIQYLAKNDLSHCCEGNGHLPDEQIKWLLVHILSYRRDL